MTEDNNSLSSSTEVSGKGIVLKLDWAVVQTLAFWGMLLGTALVLALDGSLFFETLKQIFFTVVVLYLTKSQL